MYSKEIQIMKTLASEASRLILAVYSTDFLVTEKEKQMGPVTEADLASDRVIVRGLKEAFPDDSIVSEESGGKGAGSRRVWYVDPLDGTKEFVKRNGEFCIHIGLAVEEQPVLGLVYVPVTGECAYGGKGVGAYYEREGSFVKSLTCPVNPEKNGILISSHYSGKRYAEIKRLLAPEKEIKRGSVGGKVLMICLGEADYLFYAGNLIKVWDLCAPMALIEGAGGCATDFSGGRLSLRFPDFKADKGILISNGAGHEKLSEKLKDFLL